MPVRVIEAPIGNHPVCGRVRIQVDSRPSGDSGPMYTSTEPSAFVIRPGERQRLPVRLAARLEVQLVEHQRQILAAREFAVHPHLAQPPR
jgi:hypothetical protein